METTRNEFIATQEKHHIFGNLSDLGGTIVQPVIQTSHAAAITIGLDYPTTDVNILGTNA